MTNLGKYTLDQLNNMYKVLSQALNKHIPSTQEKIHAIEAEVRMRVTM